MNLLLGLGGNLRKHLFREFRELEKSSFNPYTKTYQGKESQQLEQQLGQPALSLLLPWVAYVMTRITAGSVL